MSMVTQITPMREIRALLGLTQDQFAAATKINQSSISRWESKGAVPSGEAMAKIRKVAMKRIPEWTDSYFFTPSLVRAAIAARKNGKRDPAGS